MPTISSNLLEDAEEDDIELSLTGIEVQKYFGNYLKKTYPTYTSELKTQRKYESFFEVLQSFIPLHKMNTEVLLIKQAVTYSAHNHDQFPLDNCHRQSTMLCELLFLSLIGYKAIERHIPESMIINDTTIEWYAQNTFKRKTLRDIAKDHSLYHYFSDFHSIPEIISVPVVKQLIGETIGGKRFSFAYNMSEELSKLNKV